MIFELADLINIIGLAINIVCLFLVAVFFQNYQVNSRTLKDYYIDEFDLVSKDFLSFIEKLEKSNIKPQESQYDFQGHIATFNNLNIILQNQYKIDFSNVITDILYIQTTVEDDTNFLTNYLSNTTTSLESSTILSLNDFRNDNYKKVQYQIINKINNHKVNIFKAILCK